MTKIIKKKTILNKKKINIKVLITIRRCLVVGIYHTYYMFKL